MAALALRVNSRWMSRAPMTYFTTLQRKLTDGEFRVLGLIVATTIGAPSQPEWSTETHRSISAWTVLSENMVGRILKALEEKNLILSKRVGRQNQYKPLIENFTGPLPDRGLRIVRRKSSEKAGETQGEQIDTAYRASHEQNQSITETKYALQCGNQSEAFEEPRKPSVRGPEPIAKTPPPSRKERLRIFLEETIAPKLLSCPTEKLLDDIMRILNGAPLEPLFLRIIQKKSIFTEWGLLRNLADDVAQSYRFLHNIDATADRERYRLDQHWDSAYEVRKLHADPNTPQAIREELLLMWPELEKPKEPRRPKTFKEIDEERFAANMQLAREMGRERDRMDEERRRKNAKTNPR